MRQIRAHLSVAGDVGITEHKPLSVTAQLQTDIVDFLQQLGDTDAVSKNQRIKSPYGVTHAVHVYDTSECVNAFSEQGHVGLKTFALVVVEGVLNIESYAALFQPWKI